MPFDYKRHFPYENIRQEQDVAITFALDAFLKQDKRFVILELGTGCGKSAVGLTVAKYLNENLHLNIYAPGAYFLTTQKVLQDQYMKDFGLPKGNMASIMSASNFKCSFYKANNCGESLRALKNEPAGTPFWHNCFLRCAYKKARKHFFDVAPEGVTNYSYMLTSSMHTSDIKSRQLLVLDEAHNCESEMSKFIGITVSEKFSLEVLKIKWIQGRSQKDTVSWLQDVYIQKLQQHIDNAKKMIEKFKIGDKIKEFVSLCKQYEMLDKHFCKIQRFLALYSASNWVMTEIPGFENTKRKLEFKPVNIGEYSENLLFKLGQKILLMSATIVNRDVFCASVGINPVNAAFLSLDSPFPIENRPILYAPVGSMALNKIDETLPKLVEMIKLVLDQHKGQKGIIHAHTYKIANFLKREIKNRRLLIHDSDNRDEIIAKHMSSAKDTVLISPSLQEGIDLKDDLSRFQVICKIPYPYLGDKLVKKRMSRDRRWYPYQTAKTIVQSAGRSVRNEKDHAVTYILDQNWEVFFRQNSEMFPASFKKALKV